MRYSAAALLLLAVPLVLQGCGSDDPADPDVNVVVEVAKFAIPKSPSGMFYDGATALLHILCGTKTNDDHYLYVYDTAGTEKCLITIPEAVGMSRVDGFYIVGNLAYIVDSQGPIYADESGKLGGSVYQVDWSTHPCGCASGSCTDTSVEWSPSVQKNWALSATEASIEDGGGSDEHFRNSGIVVTGGFWYGVNGVHPVGGSLSASYPKSIIKVDMASAALKSEGFASVVQKWPFDAATLGHDVDMEGLACGADDCATALYVGDEYNFVYKFDLASGTVTHEWDCNSIVGDIPDDKGIESLAFDGTYWYIGIQETAMIYKLTLTEALTGDTIKV